MCAALDYRINNDTFSSPSMAEAGYINAFLGAGLTSHKTEAKLKYTDSDFFDIKSQTFDKVSFFNETDYSWIREPNRVTYEFVIFRALTSAPVSEHNENEKQPKIIVSDTYTSSEMLYLIKSVFGLSTTSVANIVGISRATIYNHLSSGCTENHEYIQLFNIAKQVSNKGFEVKRGLKSVLIEGKTLHKHLNSKPIEEEKILAVCEAISLKLTKMHSSEVASVEEEKLVSIMNNY